MTNNKELIDKYPEYLAVRISEEEWAHYICRGGIGGRDDVTYIRLDSHLEQLQADKERLSVLAIKHCPREHHDWQELLSLVGNKDVK